MSLRLSRLTADPEEYTGVFIDGIEEWSQFFEPCNWRTFHPAFFEVEDDRMLGGVELTLVILGLGFRLRWNYARTDRVDDLHRNIERILADARRRHHDTDNDGLED